MKKIILCTFVLLSLIGGAMSFNAFCNKNNKYEVSYKNKDNSSINKEKKSLEEVKDEPITEVIESNDISDKNISIIDSNIHKNDMESNSISNSDVINNGVKVEEKQEQIIEKPKTESTIESQSKQEPVKKEISVWESLGLSEYDYYHKPMWSWARIDFSINDYGSFEQTHQACIDAGGKLENILSFSCTTINSYSGDYLGDMLRTK